MFARHSFGSGSIEPQKIDVVNFMVNTSCFACPSWRPVHGYSRLSGHNELGQQIYSLSMEDCGSCGGKVSWMDRLRTL